MKLQGLLTSGVLAAGALLLAGSAQASPNLQFDSFTSCPTIGNYAGDTTPVCATGIDDGVSGDKVSVYFRMPFYEDRFVSTCFIGFNGGNPWHVGTPVDFTQYAGLTFDVLWDRTSGLTVDQFNTGTNWCSVCPVPLFTTPEPQNYLFEGGYIQGVQISAACNGNDTEVELGEPNIPLTAAYGWQTVWIPFGAGQSTATKVSALIFAKFAANAGPCCSTNAWGAFWIDNIVLVGKTPTPNPTLTLSATPPVPGLNVWNLTENTSYYDRNDVVTTANNGLSWAGSITSPNTNFPVAYSFTLTGFPANSAYAEAFMLLVPNAAGIDSAPDWTEATCMIYEVQSTPSGANISLSYKTNYPSMEYSPVMVYVGFDGTSNTAGTNAPPAPAAVPMLYGTYSLVFTDANDGYVSGPDGVPHTFGIGTDGATWFKENSTANEPFLVYLGDQANDAGGMNQAVVYDSFSVSGVPSAFSENFLTETATVNVNNGWTTDPAGVFLVPTTAACWVSWTTPPATGFVLENAANLAGPWQDTTCNPQIAAYGEMMQLVDNSDLVAPANVQYFRLVKRIYSKLLAALPGQTFISGTGVTGTPTTLTGGPPWMETATGYAVDANNVLMTNVTADQILLACTSDTIATDDFITGTSGNNSESVGMSGGMVNFSGSASFSWGNDGLTAPATETITLTDQSTGFTVTSAPVTLLNP